MNHIINLPIEYQRVYASLKRGQTAGNLDTADWTLLRALAVYDDDPDKPGGFSRLSRHFEAWKSAI